MVRPLRRSLTFVVLAAVFATAAQADVTLSTSTNAQVEVGTRLNALLRAEGQAIKGIDTRALKRLMDPPKSAGIRPYSRERLDTMKKASGGREWACLSEALYFEARGETVRGLFGVAEVIMNRVDDPRYPNSICGVINQGTGQKFRCQFTYTCDGRPETIGDKRAHERVGKVARLMIDGEPRRLTAGATHYHTKSVKPRWSRVFPRTTTIGYHHFYREPSRLASR